MLTSATIQRRRLSRGTLRVPLEAARLLVAAAGLAYLLLPVVFVGHAAVAHAGQQGLNGVDWHAAPDSPAEQQPQEPDCELCLLLGTLHASGEAPAFTASPIDETLVVGGLEGYDSPFAGCRIPVAALPRAPPVL